MQDVLAKKNRAVLAEFAYSNVLLGFDYDGTLAPIAVRPELARMRATTERLLVAVAHRYPSVVISGRAHDDIARRLKRVPLWDVFGNHGCEPWEQSHSVAAVVSEWVQTLRTALNPDSGIVVEDKKYSIAVHYRRARNRQRARRTICAAIAGFANARAVQGDCAINLMIRGGPDKGVALQQARRALACDNVIYVGDDATDEDAFRSAPSSQLLAVRVGRAERGSRARFRLRIQSDIDRLLEILVMLRASPSRSKSSHWPPASRRAPVTRAAALAISR